VITQNHSSFARSSGRTDNAKRKINLILSASAASVLTFSALAQDVGPSREQQRQEQAGNRNAGTRADQLNGAIKSGDLIGMTVKNYRDETLGKVEDIAVDMESGRIVQVILSTGGFLGIGDRLTAIPPGALHHDVALGILHLDADKEKVKNSPEFDMARWGECCNADHLSKVYQHYGEQNAYGFVHNGNEIPASRADSARSGSPDVATTRPGRDNLAGSRVDPANPGSRNSPAPLGRSMIPASRLTQVQKASSLVGMPVNNLQDENLGKVENLLIDIASGRVVAVVVSSGGFLGIGDELSAVPPTALRFGPGRELLQLDTTKDALAAAPHFRANEWPDFTQPAYAQTVYSAYQQEPYFTTNTQSEANSTANRDSRGRDGRGLTGPDQGNNASDLAITSRILRGIGDGKDMSQNARNVKVSTNQGQVTLRGPVDSAEEKRLIGGIANDIVLAANVDNQLEVQ
jgi:sporulation protein YlmC with PRC-barrel domain